MTAREAFGGGVAVITGAGSGIGAGLAREAGRLGMKVVVADIARERAGQVAAEIAQAKGEAHPYVVNVADADAVEALAAWAYDKFGDVRLLINNAAIETLGLLWEVTPAQWRASMDVLVNALFYGARAFVPRMIDQTKRGKRAQLVNTASLGSFMHAAMMGPYLAGKHAALALSEGLSLEMDLTNTPIDISVIVPGMVATRIYQDAPLACGPEAARTERHRAIMEERMATGGLQPDAVAPFLFEQMAQRKFWIMTHPEQTESRVAARGAFLKSRQRPSIDPAMRPFYE
jgi:NAD(P)-dependent dehydrogenase (short-subunit alcohol dehydrogenase family)